MFDNASACSKDEDPEPPFDERSDYFLEQFFHQGRLHFTPKELDPIKVYAKEKPVITIVNLERAAILTEIAALSKGLLVEFVASEATLAKILFGEASPKGKLWIFLQLFHSYYDKTGDGL